MKPALRILAAPNEDGFGPSALLSYVVKELLAQHPDSRATIWNRSRADYNRSLYRDLVAAGRVNVRPVCNLIQLAKDASTGEVSIAGTLAQIGDYRAASARYAGGVRPGNFDLVVEFGVPAAARWAAKSGIPCVSIFDHAWARTLEMILATAMQKTKPLTPALSPRRGEKEKILAPLNEPLNSEVIADQENSFPLPIRWGEGQGEGQSLFNKHALDAAAPITTRQRAQWRNLVAAIRRDESFTQKLFLFPEFISPPLFRAHWRNVAPRAAARRLSGVLGGTTSWSERQAREYLGFAMPGRIVMIQGGDTSAWDALLQWLVPAFLDARAELEARRLNVAFYIPRRIAGRGAVARLADPAVARRCPRVRAFAPVPGGTTQEIFPFVDLLVTRAGGGTVNDAIACRTPFVCVRECSQSQVEATLAACVRRGLTRVMDSAALEVDPLRTIFPEADHAGDNRRMATVMKAFPNHIERELVREILRGFMARRFSSGACRRTPRPSA
ncbi:MAG: hypothetical protein WCV00_20490 [Verrucomicrobiia bacterium]|jgi:hypothetical protein